MDVLLINNNFGWHEVGVSKKTKNQIKPRKPEKKITEKTEPWKKSIRILKKSTGLIRFYKSE
jgi:hypothetical protein